MTAKSIKFVMFSASFKGCHPWEGNQLIPIAGWLAGIKIEKK